MRALVQRVSSASVASVSDSTGAEEVTGEIGPGLAILVGVTHEDDIGTAHRLAAKVLQLRIFPDDRAPMSISCADIQGDCLVVPQFTLYADTTKGRRPSFAQAAPPEAAEGLVEAFASRLAELGARVATGRFRTHMRVSLVNDGPVTMLLES